MEMKALTYLVCFVLFCGFIFVSCESDDVEITEVITCDDGVQNGDETGIDCGGSCPPCDNEDCTDNALSLVITLDNYPKETTWDIRDESGTIVASSNGHYGGQANGAMQYRGARV